MTEILKTISEFLQSNMTIANVTIPVMAIVGLVLNTAHTKAKRKLTELLETKKVEVAKKEDEMNKTSEAILNLANMMTIAFGNSKLPAEAKIALEAKKEEIFKTLAGVKIEIVKEPTKLTNEEEPLVDLTAEKTVIEQLKEEL